MSLLDLPDDWLKTIIDHCLDEIWAMRRVCKRLKHIVDTNLKYFNKLKTVKVVDACPECTSVIFQNNTVYDKLFMVWKNHHTPDLSIKSFTKKGTPYKKMHLSNQCKMGLITFNSYGRVIYPFYCIEYTGTYVKLIKYINYTKTSNVLSIEEYNEHFLPGQWKEYYDNFITETRTNDFDRVFQIFYRTMNEKPGCPSFS